MGITAQRRWREKNGLEPAAAPSPAPLPALVPRHEHERAIQELTISYESRLRALSDGSPDDAKASFAELTEKLQSLEAENSELRQKIADLEAELEETSEETDPETTDGEKSPEGDDEAPEPKPADPTGEPKKKSKKKAQGDKSPEG